MTLSELIPVPTGSLAITPIQNTSNGHRSPIFSLIVPTYNESKNIEPLIQILTQLLTNGPTYELIIVDDNSPDHTWQIAQQLTTTYPNLRVMRRIEEKGLATAVIRGWQAAKGEILGVIDGDLQHPPDILPKLWQQITQGADLAIASRHITGGGVSDWSLTRRILSRGAQLLGLIILPQVIGRVTDPMSGYFLIRRSSLLNAKLKPKGYKILIEVLARGQIQQIKEIPYIFQERQAGESKVTPKQYIEYLQHLITLRLDLWPVLRFIKFGLVGFSGVFIDLGIFYLLRDHLHLGLTRSAIISSEIAIINNFIWNDLWTFRDISKTQPGKRQLLKRFIKFNLICLAGLILNVLIVNILFNIFHINQYLAKLTAIALVTLWNFWINLKLSWRVTDLKK